MNLRDLEIHPESRSNTHNLIQDFYTPCLGKCVLYCRAVGFFSSSSLAAAARGIAALIKAGGKMQLAASPCLSKEDAEAIACGLKTRDEVVTYTLLQELEQECDQIVQHRLDCLAWLLQDEVLATRIQGSRRRPTLHE